MCLLKPSVLRIGVICVTLAGMSGCVSLAANLIGVLQGNNRPAEFTGLEDQRVAVVVATDGGVGTDTTSALLANYIQANLNMNMQEIDIVRQSEIERWLSSHDSSAADYVEIGQGVEADRVLAVEVVNMRLRNGATLFKGQADITVTVYDVNERGKVLYRKMMPEFAFPTMDGASITDTSEAKFRGVFLEVVARRVSSLFYEVDVTADFALDATSGSF